METSVSLLERLTGQPTADDWQRLLELYQPLLRAWMTRECCRVGCRRSGARGVAGRVPGSRRLQAAWSRGLSKLAAHDPGRPDARLLPRPPVPADRHRRQRLSASPRRVGIARKRPQPAMGPRARCTRRPGCCASAGRLHPRDLAGVSTACSGRPIGGAGRPGPGSNSQFRTPGQEPRAQAIATRIGWFCRVNAR